MLVPRFSRTLLALVAGVLAVVAIWLLLDNPEIDDTSRGDGYSCAAPYDTVLNDADNWPGGEGAPDGNEIAARCIDAGRLRFTQSAVAGAAAALAAVTGVLIARRPAPRSPR
ncbi:MAG: hypothetical protein ACRCYX_12905 [Dermatophilaceae bacterium]